MAHSTQARVIKSRLDRQYLSIFQGYFLQTRIFVNLEPESVPGAVKKSDVLSLPHFGRKTALAKQAGDELVRDYGFKKLPIRDPFAAPIGSVLVYSARGAAGHVEIRTKTGFVSDFRSKTPSKRPLIGVYAKG